MFRCILMPYSWSEPEYLKIKPKLRVLILGSYELSSLERLRTLKGFLMLNGYLQTHLVKDFDYPTRSSGESQASYNLRKSEHWIPLADVAVFVFLPNVDNTGVGYELKHLIDNHYDMTWRSVVGISRPAPKISSLLGGLIERWSDSIQQVFFSTDTQLAEGVRGALTSLLGRLYFVVINRQPGEWEMSKRIV